jgi:hypothetical protein
MQVFLILAPYGVFAALMLVTSAAVSLFVSAAVCLAAMAHDRWHGRSIKILAAGSVVTFATVGLYVTLVDPALNASAVRFAVDTGILLVSVISILFRYPFTLQYALEVADPETAKLPGFIRANYVITWAWAAAMVLMMIGNAAMIYVPWLPFWGGLLVAFAARNCAIYFTNWYPQYMRAKYGPPQAGALPGPQ